MSVGSGAVLPWHDRQATFWLSRCGRDSGAGRSPGLWQTVHSVAWMPEWPGAVSTSRAGAWQSVHLLQPSSGWAMTGMASRPIVPVAGRVAAGALGVRRDDGAAHERAGARRSGDRRLGAALGAGVLTGDRAGPLELGERDRDDHRRASISPIATDRASRPRSSSRRAATPGGS